MIRLGTSGFSYDDWVGAFYPADLPRREWLAFYARQFDTCELNVTYYRVPDRRTVEGWVQRTPDDFVFAVKAHGSLTHERQEPDFAGFVEAISPLAAAGSWAACWRSSLIRLHRPRTTGPTWQNCATGWRHIHW
jgi:uncharacterized protein YecE (DUF72 family)